MPDYSVRDVLCDMGAEEAVLFENPNFDAAIIGVTDDSRAVYDYDLMVRTLCATDGMESMEAIEFIDYNTLRAIPYAGEHAPIVMMAVHENPEQEKLLAETADDRVE